MEIKRYNIPKLPRNKYGVRTISINGSVGGGSNTVQVLSGDYLPATKNEDDSYTVDLSKVTFKGDVLTEGGITAFTKGDKTTATIMDGIVTDNTTIVKENGVLKVLGGGVNENAMWQSLGKDSNNQINLSHLSDVKKHLENNSIHITEEERTKWNNNTYTNHSHDKLINGDYNVSIDSSGIFNADNGINTKGPIYYGCTKDNVTTGIALQTDENGVYELITDNLAARQNIASNAFWIESTNDTNHGIFSSYIPKIKPFSISLKDTGDSKYWNLDIQGGEFNNLSSKTLNIDSVPINKDKNGVLTINGDLAVTGNITTFAQGNTTSSTIMDGITCDETTISKKDGKLSVIGGTGTDFDVNKMWTELNANTKQ